MKTSVLGEITNLWLNASPFQVRYKLHSVASDLGLHCLLRPVCPNTISTEIRSKQTPSETILVLLDS